MMQDEEERLPTELWVTTQLHTLTLSGKTHYIIQKGNHASGTVMLKINGLGNGFKLFQQQRDFDGNMGWMDLFENQDTDERAIDDYIARATDRDPDLWVIEVEDKDMQNPFEGKVI